MNFFELNLFGVYIAPIAVMMLAAWLAVVALRRVADRHGLLRYVWHPSLFVFAVYIILLSSIVIIVGEG
jgi:protein AaeX